MPDDTSDDKHDSGRPFTTANVAKIVAGVLRGNYVPPRGAALDHLTDALNQYHSLFQFATTVTNNSGPRADRVRDAIEVLALFFEERRQACFQKNGITQSHEIVAQEQALYERFHDFLSAMQSHRFELDIDAGVLMPRIESWRNLAEIIAGAFKIAMSDGRDRLIQLGRSNDGPLPRFVAAVIPTITGENPSVANVGKHLKDVGAGVRRAVRRPRGKTGTNR